MHWLLGWRASVPYSRKRVASGLIVKFSSMSPTPLFILAAPRSFNSLVCAVLGQHPEAYGLPELNLFVAETLRRFAGRMRGMRQAQMHGMLRTVAQLYAGEQTLFSVEMARRWIMNRLRYRPEEIYLELCLKLSPLQLIDQSSLYSSDFETLQRIQEAFPNAYYLHLVRHPRTQGQALLEVIDKSILVSLVNAVDDSTQPPTLDPQFEWYRRQLNILRFLKTIPAERQLRVRGEELLSQPAQQLESLCQWLGLAWSEANFAAMLRPQDSAYACFGPYKANLGVDPSFLHSPGFPSPAAIACRLEGPLPWRQDGQGFVTEVVKLAREFGYE